MLCQLRGFRTCRGPCSLVLTANSRALAFCLLVWLQVFLHPDSDVRDTDGDVLPPLIYVSREKRPGYDHNKKAGAMNALLRASGLITNVRPRHS